MGVSVQSVGQRIQQKREERGWQQAELARRMVEAGFQYNQVTISKIEKSQRSLRLDEAAALASALHVDLAWLAGEEAGSQAADRYAAGYRDALAAARDALAGLKS